MEWRQSITNPYSEGTEVVSLNAGVVWSVQATFDLMFRELGFTTPSLNPSTIYTLKRLSDVWQSIATNPNFLDN
ncbi:unnamed protein product, partial [marine sediment metagenome]